MLPRITNTLLALSAKAILILVAYFGYASTTLAIEAVELFDVSVPVASESRQERASATKKALAILYIRVTGNKNIISRYPTLAKSLARADRYVAGFSYAKLAASNELAEQRQNQSSLQLNVVFESNSIMRLLREAGAPFWQANRPGVLVWLVDKNAEHSVLVNEDTAPQRFAELSKAAKLRGIPIIQPLLDLEEGTRISASDVWNMSFNVVTDASRRYDQDAVLVGKLSQTYDKGWIGQWTLLYRGQRRSERFRGNDVNEYYLLGFDMVADAMAVDYAVAADTRTMGVNLTIAVSGIKNHNDYVEVAEYLRKIPALKDISLSYIDGERVYFKVNSADDSNKLRALIELNRRFAITRDEQEFKLNQGRGLTQSLSADLSYRWKSAP